MLLLILLGGIIVGVLIGFGMSRWRLKRRVIGTIRVDQSDPEDNPYLFFELTESVNAFRNRNLAMVKVKNENFISHE